MLKLRLASDAAVLHYGASRSGVCALCKRDNVKDHYGVELPDGALAFVCCDCNRKYATKRPDNIIEEFSTVFYREHGKELVIPAASFFEGAVVNDFTQSVVEYFNREKFITRSQYDAVNAVSRMYREAKSKNAKSS